MNPKMHKWDGGDGYNIYFENTFMLDNRKPNNNIVIVQLTVEWAWCPPPCKGSDLYLASGHL
jgi:hypothetical protein